MVDLGPATENDMVLAFLRAEINSSRYDDRIIRALGQLGYTRCLLDEPNLANRTENRARKRLLNFRGYETREALFAGFPSDAVWRKVTLEQHDFSTLRYANHKTWNDLSDGTRLVSVGARNFRERPDDPETYQINGILEALRNGARFPELIAAQHNDSDGLILIEGHSRATAYVMERVFEGVEVFVASSRLMPRWAFY
ncbi:MAG: hypothetical protein ABSG79_16300 [Bryobacteraceae bacterium]|jgi:hypothetical protein